MHVIVLAARHLVEATGHQEPTATDLLRCGAEKTVRQQAAVLAGANTG